MNQRYDDRKRERFVCYLRFRYSFVPSLSVTYWKPFSISCASSSIVFEVRVM